MKGRIRLLLVLALAGLATAGIYLAASATTSQCGESKIVVDSAGIAIKKIAYCDGQRNWHWQMRKIADQSSLTLAVGEQAPVNYQVRVDALAVESYTVWGRIVVRNNNRQGDPILITSVSDSIASVNCGVTLPYLLDPQQSFQCTYSMSSKIRPDSNTATVTYGENGSNSATTALDWSAVPFSDSNMCITVDDSQVGELGTVCGGGTTFSYQMTVGPFQTCGSHEVANKATYTTNDTGSQGSWDWNVDVDVPCEAG